ncbi:MAG: hypothetical protein GY874_15345 [Desulfobacteraceae bacterium]|nr:hypothetical protein [Desulfobacteraceae bacterium]
MKTINLQRQRFFLVLVGLLMMIMILGGCGGGSSDTAENVTQRGDLAISVADEKGDFASYTVDLLSLIMTREDGAEVTVVPNNESTRVDFSQHTDLKEFLSVASIPSGNYVAARMTLSYSNSEIWVKNQLGELVQVKNIVDEDNKKLSVVEVSVQLENFNNLTISDQSLAHLQLDFNLSATNHISFDANANPTIKVDPYLVANVNDADSKTYRLRGVLNSADLQGGSFSVAIRPFNTTLDDNGNGFGSLTVGIEDDTFFDIDGKTYKGSDGLEAMENLNPKAAVEVNGVLEYDLMRFQAGAIYAKSQTTAQTKQRTVTGCVTSVDAGILTLKGATLTNGSGNAVFKKQATIKVSGATHVTCQRSEENFDISSIGVGQKVTVSGALAGDDPQKKMVALDATEGHVRMMMTTVRGTIVSVNENDPDARLVANLQAIDNNGVKNFDFKRSAADDTDTANNTAPDKYAIDTGSLDISDFAVTEPVKVRGFVQSKGDQAPDFKAFAVLSPAGAKTLMKVQWTPETSNAFEDISIAGITIDLQGAGTDHHLYQQWVSKDLKTMQHAPIVTPQPDGAGLFILRVSGVMQSFQSFPDFIEDVQSRLADGWLIDKMWASGIFDYSKATLTADQVDIHLK